MKPLTVRARLLAPCAPGGPLMLDGILLAGLGAMFGAARPDGWAAPEAVFGAAAAGGLGLEWVGRGWAASGATPEGPEAVRHAHRRPAYAEVREWTAERSINHSAGPDKSLRIPLYTRPAWMDIRWTCVGDPGLVARLLAHVPGIGQRTTHGYGWVEQWDVAEGGPALHEYSESLRLRHLPMEAVATEALSAAGRVRRVDLPLTPPYHDRARGVPCWQAM